MANKIRTNHNGVWKTPKKPYINQNGVWKVPKKSYVNKNGVWTQTFANEPASSDGFGSGTDGDITYSTSFGWKKTSDHRYIVNAKSFRVPSGVTLTVPETTTGVYIFSWGDIIIEGNIDLRNKGKFNYQPSTIPSSLQVSGKSFTLAKGGNLTCKTEQSGSSVYAIMDNGNRAKGGRSGIIETSSFTIGDNLGVSSKVILQKGSHIVPGHVEDPVGGLPGEYCDYYNDKSDGGNRVGTYATSLPANLILVAYGSIIIKGNIYLNGTAFSPAQKGGDAVHQYGYCSENHTSSHRRSGTGGRGSRCPSGGGAITMISSANTISGSIQTNGGAGGTQTTSPGPGADLYSFVKGGQPGEFGGFPASTAGQQLKYIY